MKNYKKEIFINKNKISCIFILGFIILLILTIKRNNNNYENVTVLSSEVLVDISGGQCYGIPCDFVCTKSCVFSSECFSQGFNGFLTTPWGRYSDKYSVDLVTTSLPVETLCMTGCADWAAFGLSCYLQSEQEQPIYTSDCSFWP